MTTTKSNTPVREFYCFAPIDHFSVEFKNDFAPIRLNLDDLVAEVEFDSTHTVNAVCAIDGIFKLQPPQLSLKQKWTYPIPPPIPTVSELDAFTSCPFFLNKMYAPNLS